MKSKSKKEDLLSDLKFVADVTHLQNENESTKADEDITLIKKSIVKKKNKAITKYL